MAARSGLGVSAARIADAAELFSESPSRVVVCVDAEHVTTIEKVCAEAEKLVAPSTRATNGSSLKLTSRLKGLLMT